MNEGVVVDRELVTGRSRNVPFIHAIAQLIHALSTTEG